MTAKVSEFIGTVFQGWADVSHEDAHILISYTHVIAPHTGLPVRRWVVSIWEGIGFDTDTGFIRSLVFMTTFDSLTEALEHGAAPLIKLTGRKWETIPDSVLETL